MGSFELAGCSGALLAMTSAGLKLPCLVMLLNSRKTASCRWFSNRNLQTEKMLVNKPLTQDCDSRHHVREECLGRDAVQGEDLLC